MKFAISPGASTRRAALFPNLYGDRHSSSSTVCKKSTVKTVGLESLAHLCSLTQAYVAYEPSERAWPCGGQVPSPRRRAVVDINLQIVYL
ncbi:hypothetical protein EVAR_69912_1 [Eumeta japonica]|uniref:Uncharacterized protein n=1 Tax=Eumeta variegata TaxID=151549 RepID=A0A4C2AC98_EUMVA|nr:hypothetical protein EVAR_69912_1 [Eumeta japonica]